MSLNKFSLEGKVAIVTGSGRSIGKGIALCMAECGADIVCTARTESEIEQTAKEVRAMGRKAIAVPFDARDAEKVNAMVETVAEEFGRVDILVNNAGTPTQWDGIDVTEKGWDALIRENLKTTFLCTQAVHQVMRDRGTKGSIINISTTSSIGSDSGNVASGAAKAAVNSYTQSCAVALAPYGIRVNAILPGQTEHPVSIAFSHFDDPEIRAKAVGRIPLGRLGLPEDIGWACVFLASDAAEFITGALLPVCGGAGLEH
jgi:NAD(P)-dependent dehydrogenase (short-subunit alcohol dehydrogenase family)